ncbi:hypothetical protein [Rhodococcus sp. 24CO]|uniref:hypothetical protein n=1 Tax=Rhodococcus sp. 24CO TaxID=3117460 RepID=UPI003D3378D3
MTWGVGLDVGNTRCTAVIAVPDAEPVIIDHESVLHHAPDGTIALGTADTHSPGVRRFLDRVTTDNEAAASQRTRGEELVATALYCLVAEVHSLTDQPLRIVAAIPPNFSARSVATLRTALDNMDLDYIELAPHSETIDACDLYFDITDSDITDSDITTGERSARGAAILAVPRAPVTAVPDIEQVPEPEDALTTQDAPSRRPVYVAAAVAGLLTAAACALAVFIGSAPTTQVPEIRDAAVPAYAEVATPTDPATLREVPIQFPTAAPVAAVQQNRTPTQRYQAPTQDVFLVDEFDYVPTEDESVEPLASEIPAVDDYDVSGEQTDPVDPGTTDPEPVDPEPVDPQPVDPEPVDPQPTDPELAPEITP